MPVADPCRTNMVLGRIRAICRRFPPSAYKGTKAMAAKVGRTQSWGFAPPPGVGGRLCRGFWRSSLEDPETDVGPGREDPVPQRIRL